MEVEQNFRRRFEDALVLELQKLLLQLLRAATRLYKVVFPPWFWLFVGCFALANIPVNKKAQTVSDTTINLNWSNATHFSYLSSGVCHLG